MSIWFILSLISNSRVPMKMSTFRNPQKNETCFQDGLDAIFIYIYTYFLLISGFTTFLFFLNCKKNRANLWISHQNMFFPWLIVLSLFGSLFFRRFFQGDFRFYMDSNADVRRKVEEFLGFGEGLNGKWMVSNFLIFVYIYIHIYIHDVCRICKCLYTYIYIYRCTTFYIYIYI